MLKKAPSPIKARSVRTEGRAKSSEIQSCHKTGERKRGEKLKVSEKRCFSNTRTTVQGGKEKCHLPGIGNKSHWVATIT